MNAESRTKCPKDNKYCYIHYCPDTGFELRCRHYNLQNYGGCCPDLAGFWINTEKCTSEKKKT